MTPQKQLQIAFRYIQKHFPMLEEISSSSEIDQKLIRYEQELQRWNKKIRLTGLTNFQEFTQRHLIDSLIALGDLLSLPEGSIIMDVGSGAGFPAIPLALFRPDLEWVLTESRQRRAAFLQRMKQILKLERMKVHTTRVAGEPEQESLPTEVSRLLFRAVNPDEILPISTRYLLPEGQVLYWGTADYKASSLEELECTDKWDYQLPKGEKFTLFFFGRKGQG